MIENPLSRYLLFEALQTSLHYQFKDGEVLRLALSHKSHANEGRKKGVTKEDFVRLHNERLEFLGDSVLGLVITDFLSEQFPFADEGKLSKMRSALVKEETLAAVARSISLGDFLLLGKGEESTQGRAKDSILASSYEAVLGAIYLDGGLPAVFETARQHFRSFLDDKSLLELQQDTKTLLQEFCQARFRQSPSYKVVSEEGPDHEKLFEVMAAMGELKRYGKGRNKKEAEQAAARFLLEGLRAEKANNV
ncbi:MAG: ribonuclease III [Bdellovibrionota bacterium]